MTSMASALFYTSKLLELIITYPAEYSALTNAQKSTLSLIISCGRIDMTTGSVIRTKIFEIFTEGTNIYADLTTMLAYTPPPGS